MNEYRSCDNCLCVVLDKDTYPCSMCIRGAERTDKWQENIMRQTKQSIDGERKE